MHIMIYVDKWNLSVVGLNLQKKNPLTSICFPINYAKHVHSCTFLEGIYFWRQKAHTVGGFLTKTFCYGILKIF